jgi:hypothetical protein
MRGVVVGFVEVVGFVGTSGFSQLGIFAGHRSLHIGRRKQMRGVSML